MNKAIVILCILLFGSQSLSSQLISFHGNILNKETGAPIEYAHVMFLNTDIGVATNKKGEFKLAIETTYLKNQVFISCLNFRDTIVSAKALYKKDFFLIPKYEVLPEIVLAKKEVKEIKLGSLKKKKALDHLSRATTMYAQFIKNEHFTSCCSYLKTVRLRFHNLFLGAVKNRSIDSKVRIRLFTKNENTGKPEKELLYKNLVLPIKTSNKIYALDFSEYDIEIPKNGFFLAIEKLHIPFNMNFIASKERSTYGKYLEEFKAYKNNESWYQLEIMDFETYKTNVTTYSPSVPLTNRKNKHNDLGKLYHFVSGKWTLFPKREGQELIMPVEVIITN